MAASIDAYVGGYWCRYHVDTQYISVYGDTHAYDTFEICAMDSKETVKLTGFEEALERNPELADICKYLKIWITEFKDSISFKEWCILYV